MVLIGSTDRFNRVDFFLPRLNEFDACPFASIIGFVEHLSRHILDARIFDELAHLNLEHRAQTIGDRVKHNFGHAHAHKIIRPNRI